MEMITEREIADVLEKRIEEIVALKAEDPETYEMLQYGVLCHQLSLTEEDIKAYSQMLSKEMALQK